MRISDWSSDVCSSDLRLVGQQRLQEFEVRNRGESLAAPRDRRQHALDDDHPRHDWPARKMTGERRVRIGNDRSLLLFVHVGCASSSSSSVRGSLPSALRGSCATLRSGRGRNAASICVASASTIAASLKPGATTSAASRSEEHTSELQSLMRISYAVFCLKKKKIQNHN